MARAVPFLVDAVSYAASVASLRLIRTPFQATRTAAPRALRVEIAEGLLWLWRQPLIRYMAFLTGGLNFCNAAIDLIVIVVARQHHVPPAAIGLIFSIASIGGLVGSLLAPRLQRRYRFGQVIAGTVWLTALLWPILALVPSPLLLGAVLAGVFLTGPIYNAIQYSYRLRIIPDELQRRVNSVFRLLALGTQPLGAALAGILLERIGSVRRCWCSRPWFCCWPCSQALASLCATLHRWLKLRSPDSSREKECNVRCLAPILQPAWPRP